MVMLIGVDPHKSTHTATVVEPGTNQEVACLRIEASLAEYRRILTWAGQWPQRRWAIENAHGLGRHLASWLLARGEQVVDVPTTATARVRQLSRGGGRKNDRIDAAAAACVAALQGDARPMQPEGPAAALAVLDERRADTSPPTPTAPPDPPHPTSTSTRPRQCQTSSSSPSAPTAKSPVQRLRRHSPTHRRHRRLLPRRAAALRCGAGAHPLLVAPFEFADAKMRCCCAR